MNWKRSLFAVGVALPIIALLFWGLGQNPNEIPSPLPGQQAPEFALEVMRAGDVAATSEVAVGGPPPNPTSRPHRGDAIAVGDTVRLAGHRGDVVVLNFWASWCLACRDEHAALSRVAVEYLGKPVQFYGVLYNDSPENGRRWIEEMGGQGYPTLLDPGARTAIEFGLYGVPETFFIDPEGKVAYKHIGPVTEALLARQIDAMLKPAPVEATS